jgi:hypothetical protein
VTADIPGAFIYADMNEILHMKLEGPLAKLLTRVDLKLYKNAPPRKVGGPIWHLASGNAVWEDLTDLKGHRYKVNPYDSCITNKMVDGKQCTMLMI